MGFARSDKTRAIAQSQLLGHLEEIVATRTAQLRQVNLNLQQEINDRMQAEDALRRNEEQLRPPVGLILRLNTVPTAALQFLQQFK